MTEINYNASSKTVEISVRIFTDDFEKAMEGKCHCAIDLVKPKDKAQTDALISSYILNHLQVAIDGKVLPLMLQGYQQEEGSTWTYFEVKDVYQVRNILVNNSLLYDYNTGQINMVHVKANGKNKTDKLDYPEQKLVFEF